MNELGWNIVWTAARVTIFAVIAVFAYALAARLSPIAAARLSTSAFGILLLLAVAAFCPIPGLWDNGDAPVEQGIASEFDQIPVDDTPQAKHSPDESVDIGTLWTFLGSIRKAVRLHHLQPGPDQQWPAIVAVLFVGGVSLGLLRLAIGIAGVHVLCRRSQAVTDARAQKVMQELCEKMKVARPINLRAAKELTTAATIGWRQPCILLPAAWQEWSDVELRAVLAHELSHIRHGDYSSGLLAQCGVVLHFYHPVVHWLAGRLRLQQELAADGLAAQFAGGRDLYLGAFARLALRQDGPSHTWPARAFLPAPGTLLRRIQMLRTKPVRSISWLGGMMPAGLLLAAVMGVMAMGGPPARMSARAEEATAEKAAKLVAFDLSFVAPDALGVLAIRPAAAFELPGLKKYAYLVNTMIGQSGKQIGLKGDLRLTVSDIEQVIASHRLHHNPDAPEGQRRMVLTDLSMIRTTRPFDWKKQIEDFGVELTQVDFEGGIYYKASMPFLPPMMLPRGMFLYMPDDRTLVVNTEEHIKTFLQNKSASMPNCIWAHGWKHVERDLFAAAIDTRMEKLALLMSEAGPKDELEKLWFELLLKNVKQGVFGTGYGEEIDLKAFGRCDSEEAAKAAVDITASLVSHGRKQLAQAKPTNESGAAMFIILGELLDRTEVRRHGAEVRWTVKSKTSFAELVAKSVTAEIK